MTLQFSIEYRTEWGQSVEVELCFLAADGKTHWQRIPLETDDGYLWKGIAMLRSQGNQLRYTYIVTNDSAVIRREWNVVPRIFPSDDAHTYFFVDHWRDRPESSYCYSDAYRVASGLDDKISTSVALYPRTYLFRVQAPQLAPGEKVALVGDQPTLGNWDCERALPMIQTRQQEWTISISGDGLRLPFQYKYVVQDENNSVRWEEGPNRQSPSNSDQVSIVNSQSSIVVALTDGEIRLEAPQWKVAGLVVPLFSLRTEGSQGVGDFGDLKEIVSWAASTGMHAVQLLPIYDTTQERTHTDSYPYNAISVHAIHPLYIDLRQLPLADVNKLENFKARWHELNALPALDYVEVIKLKEDYLHQLYEEQQHTLCQKDGYRSFVDNNAEWLQPYSVFCHLRDKYGTSDFSGWPVLSSYNRSAVMSYFEQHATEVGYYTFVQYL
ncbi:MAG: 4-alpha-glucanotransferase, partial [Bacteroidaceae bacterium]|nr:4-alpha-glucanotransferase [Bacteroidaceae bacterium]